MRIATDEELQRAYFDEARNRYPLDAIAAPPFHTVLELERVIGCLGHARPGVRVVDFGAGTGRLAVPLARAGHRVLAVDVSAQSLAALRVAADRLGVHGIETSARLPADERFAAVVGADVLHHLDLDDHLPLIRDALLDDGRAVFSEPGGLNPAWYPFLLLRHDFRIERRIVRSTFRGLRRAFERHGFVDVRVTGVGLLPRSLVRFSARACRANDAAGGVRGVRAFAYRYVVDARRRAPARRAEASSSPR